MTTLTPQRPANGSPQTVFDFDSFLGSYLSRQWLQIRECARILRRSENFVTKEIDSGRLHAHEVPKRERERKLVTTRSLALYIAETAEYEGGDYEARVRDLAGTWTPAQRKWAAEFLLAGLTAAQLDQVIAAATQLRAKARG